VYSAILRCSRKNKDKEYVIGTGATKEVILRNTLKRATYIDSTGLMLAGRAFLWYGNFSRIYSLPLVVQKDFGARMCCRAKVGVHASRAKTTGMRHRRNSNPQSSPPESDALPLGHGLKHC
jgi:hypothetical protein